MNRSVVAMALPNGVLRAASCPAVTSAIVAISPPCKPPAVLVTLSSTGISITTEPSVDGTSCSPIWSNSSRKDLGAVIGKDTTGHMGRLVCSRDGGAPGPPPPPRGPPDPPPGPRLPAVVQAALMLRDWPRFVSACRRRYGSVFTIRVAMVGKLVYID